MTLHEQAQSILRQNWRDGFTVPSSHLYPFQWLWDSGFHAMGWANFHLENARKEIQTLLSAQWENGLIPHIIFHADSVEKKYFPGASFHQAYVHPAAPKHVHTTGMTQPPVLGFVLEYVLEKETEKEEHLEFYQKAAKAIYHFHQYLYTQRDPNKEGLVYIRHNWESGTDNSAVWDTIWETFDPPTYQVERKDTSHVDQSQRPTARDYDYYLYLIDLSRQCGYEEDKMFDKIPFLIQDPLFNAVLAASNQSLARLFKKWGWNEEQLQCEKWYEQTTHQLNQKLYCPEMNQYRYYDLKNERPISLPTAMGFAPVFAGAPSQEQVERMAKLLESNTFLGTNLSGFRCASLAPTHEKFEANRYWRGPVWLQVNWLLEKGFRQYGFHDLADRIKQDSLNLVHRDGFYEYFNPTKEIEGKGGYGGSQFSWTAAVVIDFLNDTK